jgi:Ca2+-binding RTX toxin-like protein
MHTTGRSMFVTLSAGASLAFALLAAAPAALAAPTSVGPTDRISVSSTGLEGNDNSTDPAITPDARYVAFSSVASNLVANDTNHTVDVFVRDQVTRTTERVSVAADGSEGDSFSQGPVSITDDGRYVAFISNASNLVAGDTVDTIDVFVHDRVAHTTFRANVATDGAAANDFTGSGVISGNGRYVAFSTRADNLVSDDLNGRNDVFVRDLSAGTTERVSVAADGTEFVESSDSASLSTDGRYVAFASYATLVGDDGNGLRDVYLRDRTLGTVERVSVSSNEDETVVGSSDSPSISDDGRYVGFSSFAPNLVPDDTNSATDVFVRDRTTGTTTRASLAYDGSQANVTSFFDSISGDGHVALFRSNYTGFVPDDTNGAGDLFARDLLAGTTERVSVASDGTEGNGAAFGPAVADYTGATVAFRGAATNLVGDDTNMSADVFVHSRSPLLCAGRPATVVGTDGDDVIDGTPGDDVIVGLAGVDLIHGLGGDDLICGGLGADTIHGDAGNDTIIGDDANDFLVPGAGHDRVDGVGGVDTVSYRPSVAGILLDLRNGTATGEGTDALSALEDVIGTNFNDVLRGAAGPNWIRGLAGTDIVFGYAGADRLEGSYGWDQLFGGNDDDVLIGANGNDRLDGGNQQATCDSVGDSPVGVSCETFT